jgi:hypothetical protein
VRNGMSRQFAAAWGTATAASRQRIVNEPYAPLTSPWWWAALVLLAANDHLLKGAGVLPGTLTGKLSDFAGLVVAPVLLVALLRAERLLPRLACFVVTGAVFAAIKASSAATSLWTTLLALAGVHWTVVTDPTDMIALTALPIGWWIAHQERPLPRRATLARIVERAAAVVGVAACVATSGPEPTTSRKWETTAYVVNTSDARVDVRVRWFRGDFECEEMWGDTFERAFAAAAFDEGITFAVEPGNAIPLDPADAFEGAGRESPFDDRSDCQVALLQADGMPDVVAMWFIDDVPEVTVAETPGSFTSAGRVDIVGVQGQLAATALGMVGVTVTKRHLAPSCEPTGPAFQWSSVGLRGFFRVASIDTHADNCVDVLFEQVSGFGGAPLGGAAVPTSLCIPRPAFIFGADDVLAVQIDADAFFLSDEAGRSVSGARLRGGEGLILPSGIEVITRTDAYAVDCDGDRTGCNAYVVPIDDMLEFSGSATVFRGRAERVLVAPEACEADRAQVGDRTDYVFVEESR